MDHIHLFKIPSITALKSTMPTLPLLCHLLKSFGRWYSICVDKCQLFLLKEPYKGPLNANLLTIIVIGRKNHRRGFGGFSMGPQQLPQYYRNKNPPTDSIFWGNPLPLPRMQNSAVASMNLLIGLGVSRRKNTPKSRDPLEWHVSYTRIPGGWGEQPGRQHVS